MYRIKLYSHTKQAIFFRMVEIYEYNDNDIFLVGVEAKILIQNSYKKLTLRLMKGDV